LALAAVFLPGFVGTPSSFTNAAPVELRAYTWTLSAEDFEAGEFTQTAFEAGQLQLAHAERGSYVTAAHRAPFSFIAVGAEWRASLSVGAELELALRLSRDGRTWGDWQPLYGELQGDRWFGENLVTLEDAQWMQARFTLRGAARVEGLTLTAIAVSGAPTLEQARAQARPLSSTGAPQPYIIPRAAWGADESLMTWPPEYAPAKKLILHHTATSGGNDPIAEIQAIYYYHAVTLGWGDIGYNYIVDKDGNIYEGRAGGPDVIGAHTLDYNAGSVGVGNLGNNSSNAPTSPCATRTRPWLPGTEAAATSIPWKAASSTIASPPTSGDTGTTSPRPAPATPSTSSCRPSAPPHGRCSAATRRPMLPPIWGIPRPR